MECLRCITETNNVGRSCFHPAELSPLGKEVCLLSKVANASYILLCREVSHDLMEDK
jgi:hypothetical protein